MSDIYIPPIQSEAVAGILRRSRPQPGLKQLEAVDLQVINGTNDVDRVLGAFQEILLGAMVKAMRATIPESGLLGESSTARDMYQSFLDQEYVRVLGEKLGGLGLTDALKEQLGLNETTPREPATTDAPPPTREDGSTAGIGSGHSHRKETATAGE